MKQLTNWLNGIAAALAIWGLFAPVPYDAVIRALMIAPALALAFALVFRAEISLEEPDEESPNARANLNLLLYMPAAALAARALFDIQFLDWLPPSLAGVAGGAALAAVIAWADPALRRHVWSLALAFVLMTAYAFGALAHANRMYDTSTGERFETTVDDAYTRRVVRTSLENRYVTVKPWGPMRVVSEVHVDEDLYANLKPGDRICIALHPGRLGWPWYEALAC